MDLLEERSRVPIRTTYRAVGSGTGQAEFVGQATNSYKAYNHFGSGDVPMSSANYQTLTDNGREMLHVPFAIGAVSFFHSIPGLDMDHNRLNLTACLLAKIFQRDIKTWDDPEIVAENPMLRVLPDLAGKEIKVVRRALGSSSTNGATEYLSLACPATWTLGSGKTINWPEGTVAAQGSGGVSSYLAQKAYAISYLDSGFGHSVDLTEIHLKNKAGVYLNSKEANISSTAHEALSESIIPTKLNGDPDPTAEWSSVALYNLDGKDTWPITSFSYFYVDKDVGVLGDSGTLLKAFLHFVLGETGQNMVESFGFTLLPADLLSYNKVTVDNTSGSAWTIETVAVTQPYDGAGDHVLSAKRRSYGEYQRTTFASDIAALQAMDAVMMKDHDMMMADHTQVSALSAGLARVKADVAALEAMDSMMMRDHAQLDALAKDVKALKSEEDDDVIGVVALVLSLLNVAVLGVVGWRLRGRKADGTAYVQEGGGGARGLGGVGVGGGGL